MLHRMPQLGRFAKTVVAGALLLVVTSCSTFSWTDRPVLSEEQQALGVKSVAQLRNEYDTQQYWSFWRDNLNGKFSSFGRGFSNIHETFDRHFMNYDWGQPNGTR
jgi:hypothetical protein